MTRTAPRARPPVHRRSLLGALLLVTCALVATSGAPAGVASTTGEAESVELTVDSLTPGVATAGTELQLTGRVVNAGTATLRDVEVRLRLSDGRLNSRAELTSVVQGQTTSRDGNVVVAADLPDLESGDTGTYDLSRPVTELASLTEFGVYAVGVEVLATRPSGFGRVAIERIGLPWVPATESVAATGFSWLWPLVARPVRLADDTFVDDALADELLVGGRLQRLVDAGARLSQGAALAWAVDPALLSAAQDMADGYQVRARNGTVVEGSGGELAARWLEELRAATTNQPVIALPYGDPDLAAVDRAGLGNDLSVALALGREVVEEVLPDALDVTGTAWPVDGFVNRRTLAALRRDDVTTAVLDGRAVPPQDDLPYTPAGRADLTTPDGRMAGVLTDPVLTDLLGRSGPDPLLAAQRVLAETAMITSELPSAGESRAVVLAPPRRWEPDRVFLDRLVDIGARAPWMAPVSLPALAERPAAEIDRQRLRYPARQRDRELPGTYLGNLTDVHTSINNFAAVLTDRTQLVPELERSVLLLESSWWRGRPQERANRLVRDRSYLADLRDAVRIQPGNFTFSSSSGTIPLTVANELDQEVLVDVRLEPQTPRLRVQDIDTVTIGPRTKLQIEVPAEAVAGGPVVVDVSLRTPGGAPYGETEQLRITITQYGTVALYITVVAAAVLFLAAGVRVLRRLKGRGRHEAPGGEPDPAADPAPGAGPGDLAEPAPTSGRTP